MNTEQHTNTYSPSPATPVKKSLRGFAAMSPEKQREIARKGGKAAHERGTAHEFTPEEARVAGRKGGEIVSRNREHMAAIGREGGKSHRKHHNGSSAQTPSQGESAAAPSGDTF
jgi:hypothetical protein